MGMPALPVSATASWVFDPNQLHLAGWRSQQTNVKLRDLAEQMTDGFLAVTNDGQLPARATFDRIFLTAGQPMANESAQSGDGRRQVVAPKRHPH